jgi:hypothetical protein
MNQVDGDRAFAHSRGYTQLTYGEDAWGTGFSIVADAVVCFIGQVRKNLEPMGVVLRLNERSRVSSDAGPQTALSALIRNYPLL